MAAIGDAPVALQFDTARLEASRQPVIDAVQSMFPEQIVNVGFSACAASTGLQAADLVAYESYLLALQSLRGETADPRPHFRRLLEGAPDAHGFILREEEIRRLMRFTDAVMEGRLRASDRGKPGFQNIFDELFNGG